MTQTRSFRVVHKSSSEKLINASVFGCKDIGLQRTGGILGVKQIIPSIILSTFFFQEFTAIIFCEVIDNHTNILSPKPNHYRIPILVINEHNKISRFMTFSPNNLRISTSL